MRSLAEQIEELHRTSLERPRKVSTRAEIPASYQAITPEWLTDVLCRSVPNARVEVHRFEDPDSGSTNRGRISVDYNPEGEAAGLPRSLFCKATFELANKTMLAYSGSTHGEVTFYNKVRPHLDIETPRALFAGYDPLSYNSIILMKDMAGKAVFFDQGTAVSRELAQEQVGLMACFHARFSGPAEAADGVSDLVAWPDKFEGFRRFKLREACEGGFLAAEAVMPARLFRRSAEIWPAVLSAVDQHRYLPWTLNHGDIHLKNWYMSNAGKVGLTDWQGAVRGHWSRDMSYALATCLTIEDRRAWERDLLLFYLEKLAELGGPKVPFDDAFLHYRQQLFHPLAWWSLTLKPAADMPDMQSTEASLEFLSRITHAVDDLDSLGGFA